MGTSNCEISLVVYNTANVWNNVSVELCGRRSTVIIEMLSLTWSQTWRSDESRPDTVVPC